MKKQKRRKTDQITSSNRGTIRGGWLSLCLFDRVAVLTDSNCAYNARILLQFNEIFVFFSESCVKYSRQYCKNTLKFSYKMKKCFLLAMIVFSSAAGFAQAGGQAANDRLLAAPAQRGDFWICPGAETALYSYSGPSAGGSFAAAYGSKFSIGFKAAWFFDMNNALDALEFNFLLRYYLGRPSTEGNSAAGSSAGPYLQLTGGPVLFFDKEESASVPANWGRVSAGLAFGWRFLLGKLFFVEPYIRGGYPYIAGAGVSAGMHF